MGQTLGTTEPEPESVAGGISVLQCQADVRNAGAPILECQPQTPLAVDDDRFKRQRAPPAVDERISRELAGRGDQLGLVDEAEPQ